MCRAFVKWMALFTAVLQQQLAKHRCNSLASCFFFLLLISGDHFTPFPELNVYELGAFIHGRQLICNYFA